jgi:FKBP-type peptidyl-prolyl cis-trans isomerase FkpA
MSRFTFRRVPLFLQASALVLGLGTVATSHAREITLEQGIIVKLTKEGSGASPKVSDVVRAHYRGTLEDGKEFDSSYKRGAPADFPLNRVVPCWTRALQTMTVGSKATLTCPGATAYGPRGIPGVIPPNATLLFDVELVEINPKN